MTMNYNIAIIYGGKSSERDISIMSGENVGKCLDELGHNITYIDPKSNDDLKKLINSNFDVAFICLHGRGGEDGAIQGFLETVNLKYTGSKINSSAQAINKAITKQVYDAFEIPNAKYFVVNKNQKYNLEKGIAITGEDVVVKAASEGSSIGLYFAKGNYEIQKSIEKAFQFDDTVVVEKRIPGREFTVAVLEFPEELKKSYENKIKFWDHTTALPVIEIIPKNEFYDFASKYDEGGSKHVCPAEINEELTTRLQTIAIRAHKSLNCSGFSRTDFRVDEQNNIYALETNTIPGMTKTSLVPDAAASVGISFEQLCELIIDYSLS